MKEYILPVHIKNMSQSEMIKTDVNPGDFLESTLHAGNFTRQFKCGNSQPMLENQNLWPEMQCEHFFFYIDLTVKKGNLS